MLGDSSDSSATYGDLTFRCREWFGAFDPPVLSFCYYSWKFTWRFFGLSKNLIFGGPHFSLTPAQIQLISISPYRFSGLGGEWGDSFIHVRITAFASRACVPCTAELISLGGPSKGKFHREFPFHFSLIRLSGSLNRPLALPLMLSWFDGEISSRRKNFSSLWVEESHS